MALVILPGLNNLIEDISEAKKLPPQVVESALREALLKGYEKSKDYLAINIKGRIKKIPFNEVLKISLSTLKD